MSEPMRILTVRQPWAEAIVFGGKDVENRLRNVAGGYRGRVAIHSALTKPSADEWVEFGRAHPEAMRLMAENVPWDQAELGVILGVVDLVDVHASSSCFTGADNCSPWAQFDCFHLALENPRSVATPLPFTGALGLRRLDTATIHAIEAGL